MTLQTANQPDSPLIVYGHNFCGQAIWLANALQRHDVQHEWRDIRQDSAYRTELKQLANGNLSVPTVIFPDGVVMVEPWPNQVLKKLGLKKPNLLERLISRLRGANRSGVAGEEL